MSLADEDRIRDIVEAAQNLADLVDRGRSAFDSDWALRSAAERQIEIIGEASNKLSDELRDRHPSIPWPRVVGMRNIITHEYSGVDHGLVWDVAVKDAQEIAAELVQELEA